MSKILIYDLATGEPIEYIASADTPKYKDRLDVIRDPDQTLIAKGIIYLKVTGGVLMDKTVAEKAAVDAAIAAASVNPLITINARLAAIEADIVDLKKPK